MYPFLICCFSHNFLLLAGGGEEYIVHQVGVIAIYVTVRVSFSTDKDRQLDVSDSVLLSIHDALL